MEDASVRMTVDSSQAISENQKYLRAATETFNILQQKSAAYSSDIQKRIKFLEREIELQKESNRLNREKTISSYDEMRAEGKITAKQRDRLVNETKKESEEDTKELRELNKLFKQWSAEQLEANRKSDRLGSSLGRLLPGLAGSESAGGMISGASNALLMGTLIGSLAAIAIGKEVKGAMQMEPVMRDYAILRGSTMYGTRGDVTATKGMNLGLMGLTPSQYFASYSQLLRAGGGNVNEDMLGIMAAEKATGLSRGQTSSLMGVERYGEGKITPLISFFEKYLRLTSQSVAILPEILQTFSQEATNMIRITGKVDTEAIASSITAIGKAYGLTGEPLNIVTGAMRQGLQQSSNPVIQALQFRAMNKAMPGASLWEMEKSMENPLANPKYAVGFMNQLREITGGGEMYARSIYNTFGQYGISKNIASDLANGKLSEEDFIKQAQEFSRTGTGGFKKRAEGVTGELEKFTAGWQGGFERTGFTNVEAVVQSLKAGLESMNEQLLKSVEMQDEIRQIGYDAVVAMHESVTWQKKMYNWFVAAGALQPNRGGR